MRILNEILDSRNVFDGDNDQSIRLFKVQVGGRRSSVWAGEKYSPEVTFETYDLQNSYGKISTDLPVTDKFDGEV